MAGKGTAKPPPKPANLKSTGKPRGTHGGARPNSGRTSKAVMLGVVALIDKCWTVADREACVRKLAKLSNDGNLEATKLLMNYAFGRPKEVKELTGADGGAIRVVVEYADRPIEPKRS